MANFDQRGDYDPLRRYLERLAELKAGEDFAAKPDGPPVAGQKKNVAEGEVVIGPLRISRENGKVAGRIDLGGDMTLSGGSDGVDLNNGKSGIRFNTKNGQFEHYNRDWTVGYGCNIPRK